MSEVITSVGIDAHKRELHVAMLIGVSRDAGDTESSPHRFTTAVAWLTVGSGLAFGLNFVLIDQAPVEAGLWPLVFARVSATALVLIIAAVAGKIRVPSGVPLKRIYQLHPGKEDIVAAYLQRRDARWREDLAAHVERAKDPRKRVLAVFDWLQERFSEPGYNGDAWINAYGELGSTSEAVAAEVRRHKAALRDYLGELVAGAGGGRSTAHAIFLLVEGAMVTAAIEQSPKAAKQARKAAQALLDA